MSQLRLLIILFLLLCTSAVKAETTELKPLKVHLQWTHQSQFAGFYVAQARKYFQNEGLDVSLIPGGIGKNSMKELQDGHVDIAIGSLSLAWDTFTPDKPITNIAQIFEKPSLSLLCRTSQGVYTPKDIRGKLIGVFDESDKRVVLEILKGLSIPIESVKFMNQKPDGADIISGKVACGTVMNYDEYWTVVQKGIPFSDLVLINPHSLNIAAIEDGIYVRNEALESPEFRQKLVGFIRALRNGWIEAKASPTFALDTVFKMDPYLDKVHEQHALETVLTLLPANFEHFGYFNIGKFYSEKENLFHDKTNRISDKIWTHIIWNELEEAEHKATPVTEATKYYLEEFMHLPLFKLLVYFGVFTYALSGVLEAINRNYDLWGRLVLAFLSGVGGGTIRDIIIGGDRFPFYYVKDYHYPLGILLVVLAASLVSFIYPNAHKSNTFKNVKKYADVFGFSALAVYGASVSIISNMPWYWAPVLGALTCAGGGMLRDVMINQEPATFKGVIYEEAALIGCGLLILGFNIAGHYEHQPYFVASTIFLGFLCIATIRVLIYAFHIRYPKSLGGHDGADH